METWKDIKGFDGYYQISNFGVIKSITRPSTNPINKIEFGITLKPSLKRGYKTVVLQKNGTKKHRTIHRLVAETFIPNIKNKPQVNHIDGNKENNYYLNLEWCTSKENINHAWNNGLAKARVGEKHHNSKITKKDVLKIRSLKGKMTHKEIGKLFNISRSNIGCIINNFTWKNI